jgi:hypothetical protein
MWQPGYHNTQLPLTRQDKLLYIATAGAASLVLLTGRLLQPAPGRVGTHEQLGLPPCGFLHLTGIPCPGCGLTTSVAHAARLHFYESVVTQPFGLVVFLFAALSIPVSIYLFHQRVPFSRLTNFRSRNFLTYLLITVFLFSWLYKIAAMKGFFANS